MRNGALMGRPTDTDFLIRWYNTQYLPALDKALEKGIFSKYIYNQLNDKVKYLYDKKYSK